MSPYIAYIQKTRNLLKELASTEKIPLFFCYFDYLSALLFHRCLIRQYVYGNFWRYSHAQRKRVLTYHRICKLFKRLNKSAFIHLLNNKKEFNLYFKDFVKREWIYLPETSFGDFVTFAKRHKFCVVKPVCGVEGGGGYVR